MQTGSWMMHNRDPNYFRICIQKSKSSNFDCKDFWPACIAGKITLYLKTPPVYFILIRSMKKQNRKSLFNYLSDQFVGRFTGFIIGLWASRLVAHFFTTRSIHNLWGLTTKKTVVSKQTFGNLEWLASLVIGYIVFEMALRVFKNKVSPWVSTLRFRLLRRIVERGWKLKRFRLRNEGVWGLCHSHRLIFKCI